MAGLHEVACVGCGRRHMMSEARAREQRVLRCDCGQFVRLDRELSEPPAAPEEEANAGAALSDSFDDEETRMFASLEELAAQLPGGASLLGEGPKPSSAAGLAPLPPLPAPSAAPAAALYDDEDEATRVVTSPASLLRSLAPKADKPSSPPKSHSQAGPAPSGGPEDKPLWYVDLGGNETLEMTIEQLIVARRAGRLGEGALVWRAGMARWRPIGTLIPAAGSGVASRPLPPPSLPSKPAHAAPSVSRPSQVPAAEPGLGSYRRPMATLEFALEEQKAAAASKLAGPPPPPAPLPHPSAPPPPRRQSSGAPAPTLPSNQRPSEVSPISSNSGHVTAIDAGSGAHGPFGRRYSPVVIAIGISVVASAMGALLVRVLRSPPPPATATLSAASTEATSLTVTSPSAPLAAAPVAATPPSSPPATSSSDAPQVVDIDSLSVEKKPAPRPVAPIAAPPSPAPASQDSEAAPKPTPATPRTPVTSSALKQAMAGATDSTQSSDTSEASPAPPPKPKAKPEPKATSSDTPKKQGRDDPGF